MAILTAMGKTGEFTIETDGYHPEAGDAFVYKDQKHNFWFYAGLGDTKELELVVNRATTGRFSGYTPQIDSNDQSAIEENIQKYFESFDLLGREITPSNPAINLRFVWTICQ